MNGFDRNIDSRQPLGLKEQRGYYVAYTLLVDNHLRYKTSPKLLPIL